MVEVGVRDVGSLSAAGSDTVTTAESFKGIKNAFDSSCTAAEGAAKEGAVVRGLKTFHGEHSPALQKINDHGRSVGSNVLAGNSKIVKYDADTADHFLLVTPKDGDARYDQLKNING